MTSCNLATGRDYTNKSCTLETLLFITIEENISLNSN